MVQSQLSNKESHFKRKVFTKLTNGDQHKKIPTDGIHSAAIANACESKKKIIPTKLSKSLKEEIKNLFLPILIEAFELRKKMQKIQLLIEEREDDVPEHITASHKELIQQLLSMQEQVEESERWCQSAKLQIEKTLKEAAIRTDKTSSNQIKKWLSFNSWKERLTSFFN